MSTRPAPSLSWLVLLGAGGIGLCLTGDPALARAPSSGPRVLSLLGRANLDGRPLTRGRAGQGPGRGAALPAGGVLQVHEGGVLQVRIRADLVAGLAGPLRVRILGATEPGLQVLSGWGALRLAGKAGRLLLPGGLQVQLARGNTGGSSVLAVGWQIYVLQGQAQVRAAGDGAACGPPAEPVTLGAGRSARPGEDPCTVVREARPAPGEDLERSATWEPPPPWTPPGLGRISMKEVQRARMWQQREQQAARETAQCGCTEGGGPGGGSFSGKGPTENYLEKLGTRIRVRVTGFPQGSK